MCCGAKRRYYMNECGKRSVVAKRRPLPRRGAYQRAGRMAGSKCLKIKRKSPPRGEAAGRGDENPVKHPAIRSGHPPAGGAPNAIAGAPRNVSSSTKHKIRIY